MYVKKQTPIGENFIINVWSLIFRQTTQGAILVQLEMLLEGIHMTELLEFKVLTRVGFILEDVIKNVHGH